MSSQIVLFFALYAAWGSHAHVVITYPGWRGNNLIRNETFPSGMQWMYPCGGLTVSTNRTNWFIDGGTIAFQPGWFSGHETALMYINLGLGERPDNHSWPLAMFHIKGPTNNPYPGTVCLPTVQLPAELRNKIKNGDRATIQVVEAAKHGAGLFSCADIIFTDDKAKVPIVDQQNCFNSTDIEISQVAILGSTELPSACSTLSFTATTTGEFVSSGSGYESRWSCEVYERKEFQNVSRPSWCPASTSSTPSSTQNNGSQGTTKHNFTWIAMCLITAIVLFCWN